MELWIRSQNKDNLFKINGVDITKMNDNSYEIIGYTTYDIYLGKYKTKKRALEVLDEIEERIMMLNTTNLIYDTASLVGFKKALGEDKIKGLYYPYQMPED